METLQTSSPTNDQEQPLNSMNHDQILASFDELVASGVVHHSPPEIVEQYIDSNFAFEFTVSSSQKHKDDLDSSGRLPEFAAANPSSKALWFGPGSDIKYDERLVIVTFRETHILVFNLIPVIRPQLLLLTLNSYHRQHEKLYVDDIAATYQVLHQLQQPGNLYYAFFNCGRDSGASRDHKHIQILPQTRKFFPEDRNYDQEDVPYRHFLQYLTPEATQGADVALYAIYDTLLAQASLSLGLELASETPSIPHNVVMTMDWIVVIPRRKGNLEGISTPNAPGMMGSVWLPSPKKLDIWRKIGPRNVLARCGISMDKGNPREH
ncbi:MAG: hypothetical protein M1821_000576 [Bathelium mastoideum]|nr:MAG: hypothetical protein M1821_000576 [Bathelium mastoideum]